MSAHRHTATIRWERGDAVFTDRRYSRAHVWSFDGGAEIAGSSSPLVVREPFSDARAVDPEEAYTASISSCHMLFFLDFASQANFTVDRYEDTATATMGTNAAGSDFVETVVLEPRIAFSGERMPDAEELNALHERAHHACFIANSVLTTITVSPRSG
jgi:organic hydroperoxide reductase OsmC/OhrA